MIAEIQLKQPLEGSQWCSYLMYCDVSNSVWNGICSSVMNAFAYLYHHLKQCIFSWLLLSIHIYTYTCVVSYGEPLIGRSFSQIYSDRIINIKTVLSKWGDWKMLLMAFNQHHHFTTIHIHISFSRSHYDLHCSSLWNAFHPKDYVSSNF